MDQNEQPQENQQTEQSPVTQPQLPQNWYKLATIGLVLLIVVGFGAFYLGVRKQNKQASNGYNATNSNLAPSSQPTEIIMSPSVSEWTTTEFSNSPIDGTLFSLSYPNNCILKAGPTIAVEVQYPPDERSIVCTLKENAFEMWPQSWGGGVSKIISGEMVALGDIKWDRRKWLDGSLNGISYSVTIKNIDLSNDYLFKAYFDRFTPESEKLMEDIVATFQVK